MMNTNACHCRYLPTWWGNETFATWTNAGVRATWRWTTYFWETRYCWASGRARFHRLATWTAGIRLTQCQSGTTRIVIGFVKLRAESKEIKDLPRSGTTWRHRTWATTTRWSWRWTRWRTTSLEHTKEMIKYLSTRC